MAPPKAVARAIPICRSRTIVSPEIKNSSMRTYHGPIVTRPAVARARRRRLGCRAHLQVVVDRRHLPVEQEVGVGGVRLHQVEEARRAVSTRFMRKVWNGSYHSRSQWVWGTMATRRGLMVATIRPPSASGGAPVPCAGAGRAVDPPPPGRHRLRTVRSWLEGGTLPARWGRRWAAEPSRPGPGGARGSWDAGRLDERTRAAAAGLAAAGLAAGDRLVWAPAPTFDSIAAGLGALRLGAVVVPVNPASPTASCTHVVADVRPALAVAERPGGRTR